jgi:glutamate-1-semialdehyde 2,1-aminomutase
MKKSQKIFNAAKKYIPGGVNSPVRAFSAVDDIPFFVKKAQGAYLTDIDNKKYIDYIGSWGAQILGHCDKRITSLLAKQIKIGLTYGAPCENEFILAKNICKIFPSIDKIRMVNSGTEATMSAIRLARGFTKRNKIIKFDGCYHGHGDSFLIKAGSGASTFGIPNSLGVTKSNAKDTISLPYNNIELVKKTVKKNDIACIIIEPIAGNMNFIRSKKKFLEELRELCTKKKIILIFDEVMTGFRVALGGAQSIYKIKPDLTTLGKVIGGGLPVGAFGGKEDIMNQLAPIGGVYQAGTLSGNPLAMAAGIKTLEIISSNNFFKDLHKKSKFLLDGISNISEKYGKSINVDYQGGMFGIYFTKNNINNYEDIVKSNLEEFISFFKFMKKNGIFFAPSPFEAGFVSSSHSKKDLTKTINTFKNWINNK